MKTIHSPGPWIHVGYHIEAPKHEAVCNLMLTNPEVEGNIKLIAAAPDLLRVLEELVSECEGASGCSDANYYEFDIEEAKELIEKINTPEQGE